MARHVIKGDKVMIVSGSHKGKTGTVMRVVTGSEPGSDRVVVKGLNLRTKHVKPTAQNQQGGIITREAPIHISNVMPVDNQGKATRVRFVLKADGSKVRVAATTGEELSTVRSADAKKHVTARSKGANAPAAAASSKAPGKKVVKKAAKA
ncbi:MAG: 50S ribosomal protein L24 [Phycisphaerales bacterium]|nr:50S ribosomal protein L24 [Phycisphaerales bacterium]